MFKVGDIVQCQFHYPESSTPSRGFYSGYYNGDIGTIYRLNTDGTLSINFNQHRNYFHVKKDELKLILRITKE